MNNLNEIMLIKSVYILYYLRFYHLCEEVQRNQRLSQAHLSQYRASSPCVPQCEQGRRGALFI
jgi:hypothetical protein